MVTIDFETRSRVDLKKCGTSRYARDPSTEILCLAYGTPLIVCRLWTPKDINPPYDLLDAIRAGELIEAHNAGFERQIWYWICHKRYGWPDIPFGQWRCSMAACSRLALPRSLGDAGAALGLRIQKDTEGAKVMLRLCKPKKPSAKDPGEFDNDPIKFDRLYRYCKNDVSSEIAISSALPHLKGSELKLWQLDQRINLRGIHIDRAGVENALAIVQEARGQCEAKIREATEGQIETPKQVALIRQWIEAKQGESIADLSAEVVEAWLGREDLTPEVRRVLEIRQEASGSATSKLEAMLNRCDDDKRIRGNLVYHGAATGRWSGAGIQIQNFPRGNLSPFEIEIAHRVLPMQSPQALEMLLGPPIEVIKSSLRSFIRARPGSRLLVCDFASIEARVLAWLAGEVDLLSAFAAGSDIYKAMASKIYGVDESEVTKPQRQIGKTAILGLGYGMGHKSFRDACKAMAGVSIDNAFAKRVVKTYRESNARIKAFWSELNTACIRAIETRQPHRVGRIQVWASNEWLKIQLPSGRDLHYRKPRLVQVIAPWSVGYYGSIQADQASEAALEGQGIELGEWSDLSVEALHVPKPALKWLKDRGFASALILKKPEYIKQIEFDGVNSLSKKWTKLRTYGGKICENLCQSVARDLLAEAMFRVENAGYPIIATVHDEILCEVENGKGSLEEFEALMKQVPRWGGACPIEVEGYESERYRK